jgi:hypothetical protein
MRRFPDLRGAFLVGCLVLSGCSKHPASAPAGLQVTTQLIPPRDVVVQWQDSTPGAAGHIVEWDVKPDGEFVPLGYFPPTQTSYRHPDLMWETTNYYRVRAYYGPTSAEVEVSLPKDLTEAEYEKRYAVAEEYHWALPVIVPDAKPVEKKSIRNPATAAAGAPTDFKITLQPISVSGFKLTWIDHASDEDGFMIELKPDGDSEFHVVALVPPNVNSFGWAFEPPARKATVRVRAYYKGPASELRHERTPAEPPEPKPMAAPAPAPKSKN